MPLNLQIPSIYIFQFQLFYNTWYFEPDYFQKYARVKDLELYRIKSLMCWLVTIFYQLSPHVLGAPTANFEEISHIALVFVQLILKK